MPILVKDYTWTQSESRICINLPLKGTKSSNLDIINSQDFCKVSYPPFLFECWFFDKIDDNSNVAVVNNGIISLQFNKIEHKNWQNLFHPDYENKELLKKVREEAITFCGEKSERIAKQKAELKEANKKLALKEQMKLEEQERLKIEKIKETERRKATEEIESFKKIQINNLNDSSSIEVPKLEDTDERTKISNLEKEIIKIETPNHIGNLTNKIIFEEKSESFNEEKIKLPEPRSSGTIQIKFTPRVFPTPSRESQDKLEREWLEKQAEARKLTDSSDDFKDLTANEKNLEWLKEKAAFYYKQENYQTSIGVYNHAIRLFPKDPSLYSNRAACHFNVKNLIKCVEDCTRALELLTPPVQSNSSSRLKAHVRRGTAFCELELYAEGLLDYEAAIKIDPNDQELKEDAENIRKVILGTQPQNEN